MVEGLCLFYLVTLALFACVAMAMQVLSLVAVWFYVHFVCLFAVVVCTEGRVMMDHLTFRTVSADIITQVSLLCQR